MMHGGYSWTIPAQSFQRGGVHADNQPGYIALLYVGHHVLLELLGSRGSPRTRSAWSNGWRRSRTCPGPGTGLAGETTGVRLEPNHAVSGSRARSRTGEVEARLDES